MADFQFSMAGFKYPERVYSKRVGQHNPEKLIKYLNYRPQIHQLHTQSDNMRTLEGSAKQNHNRYILFGANLGPQRPVLPIGKFCRPATTIEIDQFQPRRRILIQELLERQHSRQEKENIPQSSLLTTVSHQRLKQSVTPESVGTSMAQAFRPSTSEQNLRSQSQIWRSTANTAYDGKVITLSSHFKGVKLDPRESTGIAEVRRNSTPVRNIFQPKQQSSSYYVLPKKQAQSPFITIEQEIDGRIFSSKLLRQSRETKKLALFQTSHKNSSPARKTCDIVAQSESLERSRISKKGCMQLLRPHIKF